MPILDPNGFNAAKFLYFNPELSAQSNIVSVTDTIAWAQSNDITGLASNDDIIPYKFNAYAFISDYKHLLNASPLNETIRLAMKAEGFTDTDLSVRSKYINTIYKDAILIGNNTFKFNVMPSPPELQFQIKPTNMQVGDMIKFVQKDTGLHDYARVHQIYDSETFLISHTQKSFENIGDIYTIIGINIWDIERLARINFIRGLNPPPLVPPENALSSIDSSFNPALYRLLYPDATLLSDVEAYYDFVSRRDNNEQRIARVSDIPIDSNMFTPEFDNLTVNYRLKLESVAGLQWNDKYVYGISQDDTTTSQFLNKVHDNLMSEWAIKKYVDRNFNESATFSNITVNGTATFNGPVTYNDGFEINDLIVKSDLTVGSNAIINGSIFANSNLVCSNTAYFNSNVICFDDLQVQSNLTCASDLTVSGSTLLLGKTRVVGSNNYAENIELYNSIHSGNTLFASTVYASSNIIVSGNTIGPRIGIGPAVNIDYNSNLDGIYDATLRNVHILETLDVGSNLADNNIALKVNGYVIANNINTTSDTRLKDRINKLDLQLSLDKIVKIDPVAFEFKDNPGITKHGFLADQIHDVLPSAVSTISLYEQKLSLFANVDKTCSITLPYNYTPGDEFHIYMSDGTHIWKPLSTDGRIHGDPLIPGDKVWIDRVRMRNVKVVDYHMLTAELWNAVKYLTQALREKHILNV